MTEVHRITYCPHCGRITPQKLIHVQHHLTPTWGVDDGGEEDWPATYFVAACENCREILLYYEMGDQDSLYFPYAGLLWPESRENRICEEFATRHGISAKQITDQEIEAVSWLERSKYIIDLSCSIHDKRLIYEPTWGLLKTMIDRAYEYAAASLVLFIVGHQSSAEVVARTTAEAAINILYILGGNPIERLWQYFSAYIAQERQQNRLWRGAILKCDDEVKRAHQRGITQKENALNNYEKYLNRAFQQMGFTPSTSTTWPNTFDRFKAVGDEVGYRTVYTAMCSQAHNDAEDLLNRFVIHSLDIPEINEKLAHETLSFSRMLTYFGLQYYLNACRSYAEYFRLTEAKQDLDEGYSIISRRVSEIVLEASPQLYE